MWNAGCHSPAFRRICILSSGINNPSILTSWDPVPHIPRVRQVSNIVTSGADIGTPKCKTERSPSSSVIAPVIIKSPAGAPDENTFFAVIRYPPSTFSATPEPPSQSDPPELSKTIFHQQPCAKVALLNREQLLGCTNATPE